MRIATTLTAITAILFLGCASSDDSSSSNLSTINPPDWIEGTWLLEEPNQASGFRFADDDFCSVVLSAQNCFKESIRLTENAGSANNVVEVVADDSYSIEITMASQTVTYKFKKLSDTQIEWVNDPLGELAETIYLKQ